MKRARKTERDGPSAFASIAPGLNRFSQKLFEYLCLEEENNLVISPVGISILLAMVADGALYHSLAELQSILALPQTKVLSNTGYEALLNDLNSFNNSESEIHVVNKIITSDKLKIKKRFQDDMDKYYSSSILAMDWTKVDGICKEANKFCEEKTNGRISSILTPPDVPELPSVILLNAVYLKCPWKERFNEYLTKKEPFHVDSRLEMEVDMMHKRDPYKYGGIPGLDATFIVIPFKDIRLGMMVFLPNELNGIKELEQYLSTVSFSKLLTTAEYKDVSLSLPKFRAENSIDVLATLKKMGLEEVCDEDKADFTGVSSTLPPLFLHSVIQKTFLDVNEMGVEAAAVTRLVLKGGGVSEPDVKFTVNRPFMCAIVSEDYGIPIFMAKIQNPIL